MNADSAISPSRIASVGPRPASRGLGAKLVLLVTTILIGLAAVEIAFRLFMNVTTVAFQFWDPVVGIRRMPNQQGVNIVGRTINAKYNFNAQGWNYPTDFKITRDPLRVRICLVGDSYIEAMQVDCDKSMAVVMGRAMTEAGTPAECYPFGCSGYGTGQEYQLIRHYVLDYHPDLVILFFTQNDVYDCSPYLNAMDPAFCLFRLNDAGGLEETQGRYWSRSWVRRSMAQLALTRYFLIQKRLLERASGKQGPGGIVLREASAADSDRYLGGGLSVTERNEKSWKLIETILRAARDECRARGSRLALVYRGSLAEIKAAEKGSAFSPPDKGTDPYCMDQRIDEMGRDWLQPICARLGIAYLDLAPAIVERVRTTHRPHNHPDDDHYNTDSHDAAGHALADWARRLIGATQNAPRNAANSAGKAGQTF